MNTGPEIREDPFWDFCHAFYARPGVSEVCLRLQDNVGADVTVLLYALWLATQKRRLRSDLLPDMLKKIEMWSSAVVRPLRSVRRYLKDKTDFGMPQRVAELRDTIKAQEMAAERIQIVFMTAAFPPELHDASQADTRLTARTNLTCYLDCLNGISHEGDIYILCRTIQP
jgi:uncharacterized protein (TIGR02444 family)